MINFVLMGSPGSGKGTLASYLCETKEYTHLCSGDLLREEVRVKSNLGLQIEKQIKEGLHVSDEIISQIMLTKIEELNQAKQPFILDGYPQTFNQKCSFDSYCANHQEHQFSFIFIEVEPKTALHRMTERISCISCHEVFNLSTKPPLQEMVCDTCHGNLAQRSSDNSEKASNRLDLFKEVTKPVIDMYLSEKKFIILDGNLPLKDLFSHYGELINV